MALNPVIEGLRAVAVLQVVAYHYLPKHLPGGYVGVDVFFVISGFLITRSLIESLATPSGFGTWVLAFWARRARRLLPNALLVILVAAVAGVLILSPFSWRRLGAEVSWTSLYAANWLFALRSTDYLASDEVGRSLLLHFWSLGVEEQFYLAWPLVLYPIWQLGKAGRPRLPITVAALAVASLAWCLWSAGQDSATAFFATPARAWELLAGAWLGVCRWDLRIGKNLSAIAALLGIVLIGGAALIFNQETRHPGLASTVPVVGSMLVLAGSGHAGRINAALSSNWMQGLGARSYSIYLWHWPVLVLGTMPGNGIGPVNRFGLLALSLSLSELAWRWVENPCRFRWALGAPALRVVAIGLVGSLVLTGTGLLIRHGASFAPRPAGVGMLPEPDAVRLDWPPVLRNGCHLSIEAIESPDCAFGQADSANAVVLFGDSHAAQWFSALDEAARRAQLRLHSWTKSDCPPVDASAWNPRTRSVYSQCNQWRDATLSRIEAMRPSLVVLAGLVKRHPDIAAAGARHPMAQNQAVQAWIDGLQGVIARLRRSGIAVVLIRDVPVPANGALDCLYASKDFQSCGQTLAEATAVPAIDKSAAQASQIDLWDFTDSLCPDRHCPIFNERSGTVAYRDSNHLTDTRVRELAPLFDVRLQALPPNQ